MERHETESGERKPLTIDEVTAMQGRKVRLSYGREEVRELVIWIVGMTEDGRSAAGQEPSKILRFRLEMNGRVDEKLNDWIYEREGIFRVGSGADQLYIEQWY